MRRFACFGVLLALGLTLLPPSSIARTWVVKADGTGDAPTIQAAIDSSMYADSLVLAPGTYTGAGNRDVNFNGKEILLTSMNGAAATIIDCQGLGRGFIFENGELEPTTVSNVTIRNGSATQGGAIYAELSKPNIVGCIIENNTASDDGGGIYMHGGAEIGRVVITGNVITGNTVTDAAGRGGGIYTDSRLLTIQYNTISGNSAGHGGGVYITGESSNALLDNTINGNTAQADGGGVHADSYAGRLAGNEIDGNNAYRGGGLFILSCTETMGTCVVANNTASFLGGGMYVQGGRPTLLNFTIVYNNGSGAVITYASNMTLERSIVAFNNTYTMHCYSVGNETVSCSDIFGNTDNTVCADSGGNISADPVFCDAASGDYHIDPTSPCASANNGCSFNLGAKPVCSVTGIGDTARRYDPLLENFPNPFNPSTTIRYHVPDGGGVVRLAIYDVSGRLVRLLADGRRAGGVQVANWDGRDSGGMAVASGVYFCRVTVAGTTATRRMVLLK